MGIEILNININQFFLSLFGVISIVLINLPNDFSIRRLAPIIGLCGQPFWFMESYTNEQWGMFLVTFVYTISWIFGLINITIKSNKTKTSIEPISHPKIEVDTYQYAPTLFVDHKITVDEAKFIHGNDKFNIAIDYKTFVSYIEGNGLPKKIYMAYNLGEDTTIPLNNEKLGIYGVKPKLSGYDCIEWLLLYCNKNACELPEIILHNTDDENGNIAITKLLKSNKL